MTRESFTPDTARPPDLDLNLPRPLVSIRPVRFYYAFLYVLPDRTGT